jgi:hypothetical protein
MGSATTEHSISGRHKFTREEDDAIRALILRFGDHDWGAICRHLPGRTPRQCRHRYYNYLVDAHQQTPWTESEEQFVWDKFLEMGPKWAWIATMLWGRTGNDVKNRFHKHISKRFPGERKAGARADSRDPIQGPPGEAPFVEGPPPLAKPAISAYLQSVLN